MRARAARPASIGPCGGRGGAGLRRGKLPSESAGGGSAPTRSLRAGALAAPGGAGPVLHGAAGGPHRKWCTASVRHAIAPVRRSTRSGTTASSTTCATLKPRSVCGARAARGGPSARLRGRGCVMRRRRHPGPDAAAALAGLCRADPAVSLQRGAHVGSHGKASGSSGQTCATVNRVRLLQHAQQAPNNPEWHPAAGTDTRIHVWLIPRPVEPPAV